MSRHQSPLIHVSDLALSYEVRRMPAGRAWWKNLVSSVYEMNPVLQSLSWTLDDEPGITALLGKNGSGKTTFLKVLTGILSPSAGHVSVMGMRPQDRKAKFLRQIGVVFGQKRILWPELSVLENLRMTGALYSLSRSETEIRIQELAATFGLKALLERPQKSLSLGESMKAEILNALLPRPKLLFLDEPSVGLDVQAQVSIRKILKECVARDKCHIILTSHNLRDIAELSTKIFMLEDGRLKALETQANTPEFVSLLETLLTVGAA